MKQIRQYWLLLSLGFAPTLCCAADNIELETTIIKGNKELPRILYLVPWQDTQGEQEVQEHTLVLHSIFGDLFDPLAPDAKLTVSE